MINYTSAAVDTVSEHLKKLSFAFSIFTQLIYILYLAYALFTNSGNTVANIILGSISVLYFTIYLIAKSKKLEALNESIRIYKTTVKAFKLAIKALMLFIAVYGIYTTVSCGDVTPLPIILTSLMVVLWILQVTLEIVISLLINEFNILKTGVNADIDSLKKMFSLKHRFAESDEPVNKTMLYLEGKVAAKKAAKREQKTLLKAKKREKALKRLKAIIPHKKSETSNLNHEKNSDKPLIKK